MARDVLFEIGLEEVPAKFMPGALEQLARLATEKMNSQRIGYREIKVFGTPRRLALIIYGVQEVQADKHSENKGPSLKIAFDADGNPTKAVQGFARGQGVTVESLIQIDGYVYARVEEKGGRVADILPQVLTELVLGLNFPKNMRWGSSDFRFVRPIKWITALFGNDVVDLEIAKIKADKYTFGHRFLSNGPLTVNSAEEYFVQLENGFVIVDQDVRRDVIRRQVEQIAYANKGVAVIDEDLLEEVLYLVEYPTALCGSFDSQYLTLPQEAIVTPMREHQRYFPVLNSEGRLMPLFITVRNGTAENIQVVQRGNERVLRARLADAQFFYNEDCKLRLAERVEKLKTIVFQDGLGTMHDKAMRIKDLALKIAAREGKSQAEMQIIERGAFLAKADLVTGMVCEFTELQGTMGREYALRDGEDSAVAEAIYEHYLPRFAKDDLPSSVAGQIIGLADKVDNIVATFSRGLIPTGSQDPFALRRQALGIVNIMVHGKYNITLTEMLGYSFELFNITDTERRTLLLDELQDFFRLRLKNLLTDEKISYDIIDSTIGFGDNVYDTVLRARTLAEYVNNTDMQPIIQAFTRAGNLVKNTEAVQVKQELFEHEAEAALYKICCEVNVRIELLMMRRDYTAAMDELVAIVPKIEEFFAGVMVMVENMSVRANRLAILAMVASIGNSVADLSKIIIIK